MITPKILKGFRDFLPQKMSLRRHIIATITSVFETFGFEQLDTPCLEYAETLEGKYGDEGDKLIYKFLDRGGRSVALRYDLTIPLSRVIAMHPEIIKPFKRYQVAPVWRADKPQKGRFREFYQCDIDIIGSDSPYADAELLVITATVLQKLGFNNFVMRINNRKVLNALALKIGLAEDSIPQFLRSLDKLDKIGPDGVLNELLEKKILDKAQTKLVSDRLLQRGTAFEDIKDFIKGVPLGEEGCRELDMIRETLRSYQVADEFFTIDITLARGLDYYTGPIFETIVKEPKIGSITGGGRYDNLIGLFTKNPLPATGTSFGLERIITVMEELGRQEILSGKAQVLITFFDETSMSGNLRVARMLREANIATEVYFSPVKLKKQLSYAAGRGIPFVIIIGPDESRQGVVTLKNMKQGEQSTVSTDALVKVLRQGLGLIER